MSKRRRASTRSVPLLTYDVSITRSHPTITPPPLVSFSLNLSRTPRTHSLSQNQMGGGIDQNLMLAMMAGLADKSRMGSDGKPTSLIELGYTRIGMDDNWQACGSGLNGSFHSADGAPLWNMTAFPDVKGMNTHAHDLGLKTDWYINNCICSEKGKLPVGFSLEGNAKALVELGFDGV